MQGYLRDTILALKPRAVARALPVIQAHLPPEFEIFRQKAADGTGVGDRRYVGVLRLVTEYGVSRVREALDAALASGFKEPSDVRLLVLRQTEGHRVVAASWMVVPHGHSPVVVELVPLSQYGSLMAVAG
jgi:hypothetical protein